MKPQRKLEAKDWLARIAKGILALALATIFIYNAKCNPDFLEMSLFNILVISISLGVTYHLVQKRTDERRNKDGLAKIIERTATSIQITLGDNNAFSSDDWGQVLINQRFARNKIDALASACSQYGGLEPSVSYIEERFDEWKKASEEAFFAKARIDEFSKDRMHEAKKLSNDIIAKCDDILISLYKNQ